MKRIILVVLMVVSVGILFYFNHQDSNFTSEQKDETSITPLIQQSSIPLQHPQQIPTSRKSLALTAKSSTDRETIQKFADKFSIPNDIKNILLEAEEKGTSVPSEGKVPSEELMQAGLTEDKFKQSPFDGQQGALAVSYTVSDKSFEKMYQASLPLVSDTEESILLKSEALTDMGVSAIIGGNDKQAQKALSAVIAHYGHTKAGAVASLELARYMKEKGNIEEAKKLVDKSIAIYRQDKDFLVIANELKSTLK